MSYNVYVIELDKEFGTTKKAQNANPFRTPDKPCVYVGYTSKTPEKRFDQHMSGKPGKKGYKLCSRVVYMYGIRLLPDLYAKYNPIPSKKEAMKIEIMLAENLRKAGLYCLAELKGFVKKSWKEAKIGVLLLQFNANGFIETRKMVLVK